MGVDVSVSEKERERARGRGRGADVRRERAKDPGYTVWHDLPRSSSTVVVSSPGGIEVDRSLYYVRQADVALD